MEGDGQELGSSLPRAKALFSSSSSCSFFFFLFYYYYCCYYFCYYLVLLLLLLLPHTPLPPSIPPTPSELGRGGGHLPLYTCILSVKVTTLEQD